MEMRGVEGFMVMRMIGYLHGYNCWRMISSFLSYSQYSLCIPYNSIPFTIRSLFPVESPINSIQTSIELHGNECSSRESSFISFSLHISFISKSICLKLVCL